MAEFNRLVNGDVEWSPNNLSGPKKGLYRFRGVTREAALVYQHCEDLNIICIEQGRKLIPVQGQSLEGILAPVFSKKGGANFGLTQSVDNLFSYNTRTKKVTVQKFEGKKSPNGETAEASVCSTFNVPSYIIDKNGNKYYPREYWYTDGNVNYYSLTPPGDLVDRKFRTVGASQVKNQEVLRLSVSDVKKYDKQVRVRTQDAVMGFTARDHLMNTFAIPSETRSWHWCHLVAHSFRQSREGQIEENLVAGTDALNGAMLTLEQAVKNVLLEGDIDYIDYHVKAEVFHGSHIGKNIKITVGQFDNWVLNFYFEANNPTYELTRQAAEFAKMLREKHIEYNEGRPSKRRKI